MHKAFLLLAASTLIAATPAADLDGNGEVTRAEFMAAGEARFTAADTDFDGFLNRDEMDALRDAERSERTRKHFSKLDANGDGAVTEAEMLAAQEARLERKSDRREERRAQFIERFDTDDDGVLSEEERSAVREQMGERRAERKGKRKGRFGKKRPRLDADGDGLISRAEYDAMGEKLFDRMDANGDGVLTKGEGRRGGHKGGPRPGF